MPRTKVQCWNIFTLQINIQKKVSLLPTQTIGSLKNDFWKQKIVRQAMLEN